MSPEEMALEQQAQNMGGNDPDKVAYWRKRLPEINRAVAAAALASAPYTYPATVERVVDGDTVVLSFSMDAGFHDTITRKRTFRLAGINAPEKNTPQGKSAKAFLETLLYPALSVTLTSVKVDKYASQYGARYDAILTLQDGRTVQELLIAAGHALPWDGKGKAPVMTAQGIAGSEDPEVQEGG